MLVFSNLKKYKNICTENSAELLQTSAQIIHGGQSFVACRVHRHGPLHRFLIVLSLQSSIYKLTSFKRGYASDMYTEGTTFVLERNTVNSLLSITCPGAVLARDPICLPQERC